MDLVQDKEKDVVSMGRKLQVQGKMDNISQVMDTLVTLVKDALMKETLEEVLNQLTNYITRKCSLVLVSIVMSHLEILGTRINVSQD